MASHVDPNKLVPASRGNARRLVRRHGKNVRFIPEWRKWIVWNGSRWDIDNGAAHHAALEAMYEQRLDRWRRLGEGPPITKLGRRILYRRSSSQAWLRARERDGHRDNG